MISTYFSVTEIECTRNNRVLFTPISFCMRPGEIKHIRGENGIGKTTLLRCLAGLSNPHSGQVLWQGNNIFEDEDYQNQRLFIGHKNAIKSALTVYENLLFSPAAKKRLLDTDIYTALDKMGLQSKENLFAGMLSSGQKQRLALSRLLLFKAKLWILDEPFNALDNTGFNLVQDLMIEHLSQGGMIILTTHNGLTREIQRYSALELTAVAEDKEEVY